MTLIGHALASEEHIGEDQQRFLDFGFDQVAPRLVLPG